MPRGRHTTLKVHLSFEERQTLESWQHSTTITAGRARRGRIILLVADGTPISHIAVMVDINRQHIYKWARRFLEQRVDGLSDKSGRGRTLASSAD